MRPHRKTGCIRKAASGLWCPYIRDHLGLKAALSLATFMGAVLLLQSPLDLRLIKQEPCQFGESLEMQRLHTSIAAIQHLYRIVIGQMRRAAAGLPNFRTRASKVADILIEFVPRGRHAVLPGSLNIGELLAWNTA
jgi:hypothetical protein